MTPSRIRRTVACGDATMLTLWRVGRGRRRVAETPAHSQALGVFLAEPLAPLLAPPRGWDIDAPERAHIAGELAAWPMPRGWTKPVAPRSYWYRARPEAPPLRAPGVVGDLDAARMDPAVPDRRSKVRRERGRAA